MGLVLYVACVIALTVFYPAELQQVDENHFVRYKFAFQWCEGQGDPWWSLGTEVPVVAHAQDSQLGDGEPGVLAISPEEREKLTPGKCLHSYS